MGFIQGTPLPTPLVPVQQNRPLGREDKKLSETSALDHQKLPFLL
jgi:hypothetical protein